MLYEQASPRDLGIVRCLAFSLYLVRLWPRLDFSGFPPELFIPRGLFRLFPDAWIQFLFSPAWLASLPWLAAILLGGAAIGLRPWRFWGPAAFGFIFLVDGMITGFHGFTSHGHLANYLAVLILACSPAADGFCFGARRLGGATADPAKPARVLFLLTLVLLLAYTFIGINRIYHGRVEVFAGDSFRTWLIVRGLEPSLTAWRLGLDVASSGWLLAVNKFGFFLLTVLEAVALFCFLNRGFALFWLLSMAFLHCFTVLLFNIAFWENIILLLVLMLPRSGWREAPADLRAWLGRLRPGARA